MTLRRSLSLIAIVYLLAFACHTWHLKKTVYGDGIFYFSWLRSIVVDQDINFANEYNHVQVLQPRTSRDTFGNKYSIGPAILWSPPYVMLHTAIRGDGWGLPYQVAVGVTSVLAALAGLALLTRLIGQSIPVVSLTLLLIAGATNLLFYGSIDPVNSHALSFFVAVVYLNLLAASKRHWFAIGIVLAILASIRLQDLVYVFALIPIQKHLHGKQLLLGFLLGFSPQLVSWWSLYGTLANPYLAGGEYFDLLRPHIVGVLFSPQSGLFLWTPIVAIGVYGLAYPSFKKKQTDEQARNRYAYLGIFALQLYFIASWSTWWQGASISGRMFVSSLPLIAIGLGDVVARIYTHRLLRSVLPLMVAGICIVNGMGIFYYLFTN